jgi:hypothetical protein
MKLIQNLLTLQEAKVGGDKAHLAMEKMVAYIQRKLGEKLIKIPGVEHYHNSDDTGYGYRYVFAGSTRCIRFNWNTEPKAGQTAEIMSIDIFTGKHDPSFTVRTKGMSLVKALPALVGILHSPTLGKQLIFPVDETEAVAETAVAESSIFEAKRDDFTAKEALTDFLKQLTAGKTFTRSEFIGTYHIVHVGIFDTVMRDFKEKFTIDGKRIAIKPGTRVDALADSILSKAGVIEVSTGGTKEVYLKTKQEEAVEGGEQGDDRIPYGDVLEHLEGLVQGIIKGAFNALFVAGKGGSFSGSTLVNIMVNDSAVNSDDNHQTENKITNHN